MPLQIFSAGSGIHPHYATAKIRTGPTPAADYRPSLSLSMAGSGQKEARFEAKLVLASYEISISRIQEIALTCHGVATSPT